AGPRPWGGGRRGGWIGGRRASDGGGLAPPGEWPPAAAGRPEEWVRVGPCAAAVSWAWLTEPLPKQPLQRPFAWALIRLDGADTAMLHAVDAADSSAMRTGMRVTVRWRPERVGDVRDIESFVPE